MENNDNFFQPKEKKKKSDKFVFGFTVYILGLIMWAIPPILVFIDSYIKPFITNSVDTFISFLFFFDISLLFLGIKICKDELSKKELFLMYLGEAIIVAFVGLLLVLDFFA